MKQKTIFILLAAVLAAVLVVGYINLSRDKSTSNQNQAEKNQNKTAFSCAKEKNCCVKNDDCEYVWFAGGCNVPEYTNSVMNKCRDGSGPCPSEAPSRENVTCTCENNKCITHG